MNASRISLIKENIFLITEKFFFERKNERTGIYMIRLQLNKTVSFHFREENVDLNKNNLVINEMGINLIN